MKANIRGGRYVLRKQILSLIFAFGVAAGYAQETTAPAAAEQQATEKPAATASKKVDVVFGDSLAEGIRMSTGLPGDAKQGRNPQQILAAIQKYDASLKGKTVLLSSGAANNAAQLDDFLPQQITVLQARGVKDIVIIGISAKQKNATATNAKLKNIAKTSDCVFAGPIANPGPDNVHPAGLKGYASLFKQAETALNAPPPAPKKSVISPNLTVEERRTVLTNFENSSHQEVLKLMQSPIMLILARQLKDYPFLKELRDKSPAHYQEWVDSVTQLFIDHEKKRHVDRLAEIAASSPTHEETLRQMRSSRTDEIMISARLIDPLNKAREDYTKINGGVPPTVEQGGLPPVRYVPVPPVNGPK